MCGLTCGIFIFKLEVEWGQGSNLGHLLDTMNYNLSQKLKLIGGVEFNHFTIILTA